MSESYRSRDNVHDGGMVKPGPFVKPGRDINTQKLGAIATSINIGHRQDYKSSAIRALEAVMNTPAPTATRSTLLGSESGPELLPPELPVGEEPAEEELKEGLISRPGPPPVAICLKDAYVVPVVGALTENTIPAYRLLELDFTYLRSSGGMVVDRCTLQWPGMAQYTQIGWVSFTLTENVDGEAIVAGLEVRTGGVELGGLDLQPADTPLKPRETGEHGV